MDASVRSVLVQMVSTGGWAVRKAMSQAAELQSQLHSQQLAQEWPTCDCPAQRTWVRRKA